MKNILIVSPYFIPFIGVGAQRMSSLAKYLSEHGWKVTVLANSPESYRNVQEMEMIEGINRISVKNTGSFYQDYHMYRKKVKECLINDQYDLMLTTSGPFYTMLLSGVHKKYGVPVIIDFRDFWVDDPSSRLYGLKKWVKSIFINYSIKNASKICVVSNGMKQTFLKKYRTTHEKVEVVYNGYEELDFNPQKPVDFPEGIVIGVFGKLSYYSNQKAEILAAAMRSFKFPIFLYHVGEEDKFIKQKISKKDSYLNVGTQPYEKTVQLTMFTTVNVVINEFMEGIGTKVFDYIRAKRPILAITPKNSEMAEFLRDIPQAFVADRVDEIIEAIKIIVENPHFEYVEKKIIKYSRTVQNEKYCKLIEEISESEKVWVK